MAFLTGAIGQTDQKAQNTLKAVSEKYKSLKSIKALFTITIENGKDKSKEVQKGTLYLKGSKYKLEIAGQDILSGVADQHIGERIARCVEGRVAKKRYIFHVRPAQTCEV